MRISALTSAFVVAAISTVGAQETTRVRVTGTQTLNLPGQVTIDGNRVSGTGIVDMDENVVHVKTPDGNGVWTVPRNGKRLTGMARGTDGTTLELHRGGDSMSSFIPLAAIRAVEISEGRRPNHGIALGILTGVGTFYGILGISFANCGLGCRDNADGFLAIGAGIAAGTGLAHHLRREHWRTVPPNELAAELTRRVQ